MAQQQNKLLKAALAIATGLMIGCAAEDSETHETVTSSTALAVQTQSEVRESAPVVVDGEIPTCENSADPDRDGWGWENQRSCKIDSTTADFSASANDLPVGIVYFLWHCAAKNNSYGNGEELNITQVLNGKQSNWGNPGSFHWWDKPSEGYYCLGNQPDVIVRHLELLRDAGVDYLVLDMTNHPNTFSVGAEKLILESLYPLLESARNVPDAPRIVPWVPLAADTQGTRSDRERVCASGDHNQCAKMQNAEPMYQHVTNLLQNRYPELTFEYEGKPLILEAANDRKFPRSETAIVKSQLENNWSIRPMWGLRLHNEEWQFLTTCENPVEFYKSNGWSEAGCNQPVNAGEQISVTAAYQYTYISEQFTVDPDSYAGFTGGMPKFQGRTMAQQFRVAFENRDSQPMVILTGWNEWIAQRFDFEGRVTFVDVYDSERNRDIEPGGASGDLYYYLMKDLITQYRNNKPFVFEDYFLTEKSIFDAKFYWQNHADLQLVFNVEDEEGLLNHWLTVGKYEGRRPSVVFNAPFYRDRHPELGQAGINSPEALLKHFIDFGFQEGRQGSAMFHAPSFIQQNEQVANMFGNNGYYKAAQYYIDVAQYQQ